MASSLLSTVDWGNLKASEYVTAYRLLMSATSERIGVAYMKLDGTYFNSGGFDPEGYHLLFPWASNLSPEQGVEGWPYYPMSSINYENFLKKAIERFIDHENISNRIGTDVNILTYWTEARIFSHFGITEWPDLSVLNKESLETWYNILTGACKYVTPFNTDHGLYEWNGIFDGNVQNQGINGAIDYSGNLSNFNSDYTQIYGGPSTGDEDDSFSFPPTSRYPYYINASDDTDFLVSCIYETSCIHDLSTSRATVGYNGSPVSARYFDNWRTNTTSNSQATDELFEVTCNLGISSDVVTSHVENPSISNPISGGLPSPAETFIIQRDNINTGSSLNGFSYLRLIWLWDAEGGFDYYTP